MSLCQRKFFIELQLITTSLLLLVVLCLLWTLPTSYSKKDCEQICLPCSLLSSDANNICCDCKISHLDSYLRETASTKELTSMMERLSISSSSSGESGGDQGGATGGPAPVHQSYQPSSDRNNTEYRTPGERLAFLSTKDLPFSTTEPRSRRTAETQQQSPASGPSGSGQSIAPGTPAPPTSGHNTSAAPSSAASGSQPSDSAIEIPRHPDHITLESRTATFTGWPSYLDQTPRQMSEAGFFCVGHMDAVAIAIVDQLKEMGFAKDRIREAMQAVRRTAGHNEISTEKVVDYILSGDQRQGQSGSYPVKSQPQPPPQHQQGKPPAGKKTDKAPSKKEGMEASGSPGGADVSLDPEPSKGLDVHSLKAENKKLKELQLCKVCMERNVAVTFLPCGHLVCCSECAPVMRECPICRQNIKGTVKTFMP